MGAQLIASGPRHPRPQQ